jgi:GGDEF domain-containing protein
MLDLDGLKKSQRLARAEAGDQQIRALAVCMRATMRVVDSGYRIGGDELMVLLPD